MPSNAAIAFSFFKKLGWLPHQAAGIVGNLMQESGRNLNATATGDAGTSHGVAQWRGPRFKALQNYAARRGKPWQDIETQLGFVDFELRTREREAGNRLKRARDVTQATEAMIGFERPRGWSPNNPRSGHGWSSRLLFANEIAGVPNVPVSFERGTSALAPGSIAALGSEIMDSGRFLRKGFRDPGPNGPIAQLQAFFNTISIGDYGGNSLAIDGIFGGRTREAVRNYQDARGISVDGVVGPETFAAMLSDVSGVEAPRVTERAFEDGVALANQATTAREIRDSNTLAPIIDDRAATLLPDDQAAPVTDTVIARPVVDDTTIRPLPNPLDDLDEILAAGRRRSAEVRANIERLRQTPRPPPVDRRPPARQQIIEGLLELQHTALRRAREDKFRARGQSRKNSLVDFFNWLGFIANFEAGLAARYKRSTDINRFAIFDDMPDINLDRPNAQDFNWLRHQNLQDPSEILNMLYFNLIGIGESVSRETEDQAR